MWNEHLITFKCRRLKLSSIIKIIMADYWKSQPRKFCQYCKCWIADNKPSIDFHERGKNHKENVAAKIEEIKKKSIAKAKQEKKMSKEFAAMEEAALKAYEQDLKRLSGQSGESLSASPAPAKPAKAQSKPKPKPKPKRRPVKAEVKESRNDQADVSDVWLEGSTDDGQIYYYNTITGESQWEKPEVFQGESSSVTGQTQGSSGGVWMEAVSPDGYTYYYNAETGESSWKQPDDLEQQNRSPQEETREEAAPPRPEALSGSEDSSDPPQETTQEEPAKSKQTKVPKISFRKQKEEQSQTSDGGDGEQKSSDGEGKEEEEEKETDKCVSETFPAIKDDVIPAKKPRRMNPYGAWEQIQMEDDPYVNVDLQLPHTETADAAPSASDLPPEPKARFKERTITSLGDDECDAGTTFKKRKTENGKSRSLRQRAQDE